MSVADPSVPRHTTACPTCGGSGYLPDPKAATCQYQGCGLPAYRIIQGHGYCRDHFRLGVDLHTPLARHTGIFWGRQPKSERNARLRQQREEGSSVVALSKQYGISQQRVRQILGGQHRASHG